MLTPATRGLIDLMRSAPRGPRRDGLFALWLAVHVAEDLGLATGTAERAYRRRVALLEKRISSLALPLALNRGLARMIEGLKNAPAGPAGLLLSGLVGPVREAVGTDAADLVQKAARSLR